MYQKKRIMSIIRQLKKSTDVLQKIHFSNELKTDLKAIDHRIRVVSLFADTRRKPHFRCRLIQAKNVFRRTTHSVTERDRRSDKVVHSLFFLERHRHVFEIAAFLRSVFPWLVQRRANDLALSRRFSRSNEFRFIFFRAHDFSLFASTQHNAFRPMRKCLLFEKQQERNLL